MDVNESVWDAVMTPQCTRCGTAIGSDDARYTRTTPEAEGDDHFCSLNCLTDTSQFDEAEVQRRLFEAAPAET